MSIIKTRDIKTIGGSEVATLKAAGILTVTEAVSSVTNSDGVSSVTDNAKSDYTINFDANLFWPGYILSSSVSQIQDTAVTNLKVHSTTSHGPPTLKTTSAMQVAYYTNREPTEAYFTITHIQTSA